MELRELGNTGLRVTPIGLGLAALGRPGYINLGHARDLQGATGLAALEARCHQMLDAAWALGIRYFDAARSYGRAEDFLAAWLDKTGARPTVGSKWGYTYTADWRVDAPVHEVKDHSLPVLMRQWDESRALLGERLDLYQIHSATRESGVLTNGPVLDKLAQIKAAGVRIGLSVSGPQQADTLKAALAIERDGVRLFDVVQATWNLLEPSAGEALREARNAGMGVIVKEGVANGRLTGRNTDAAFAGQRRLLEQEARRLETTVDALALAAVLAQPWVDVVLSGAAGKEQLAANVAALQVSWDEQTARVLAELAEPPEDYWRTRGTLAWN